MLMHLLSPSIAQADNKSDRLARRRLFARSHAILTWPIFYRPWKSSRRRHASADQLGDAHSDIFANLLQVSLVASSVAMVACH